ncbi:shikimate O-hydroxycinnamoyltransferase [Salvia divinorum]|uniref:Shikimate O-hydroxycinnamoyltransferase n=1 Tax=Salvia divinorum TaxID=28513 RepID=A0ABD1I894_SALDI
MKITVKESIMVKPMEETPRGSVWLSNLDLVLPDTYHTRWMYLYRYDGDAGFFNTAALKAALSRALVDFYPYAGRLRKDDNGRIEINCNGEGVLFVEAECDGSLDDLGDFCTPKPDLSLTPTVDYSHGISTFPLFLVKLTRFKCGGVSLGFANDHHTSDGISAVHFINTWSEIARGLTTVHPISLDRSILSAHNPSRPIFRHIEHQPLPPLKTTLHGDTTSSTFRLSRDHINALKQKCNDSSWNYTTYEVVAGHVWRCVSIARRLPRDQETKLQFPLNARQKLRPPLPEGYFGNGIFYTGALALSGELESKPLRFAVERVHEAIARMDDEYLRSALDYLELHMGKVEGIIRSQNNVKCPNFGITNWVRLSFYEADFGWGKPVFAGPGGALFEGKSFLFAGSQNEGGALLAITLHQKHMKRFQKLLYNDDSCLMSKI